jgi:hypothetical protein
MPESGEDDTAGFSFSLSSPQISIQLDEREGGGGYLSSSHPLCHAQCLLSEPICSYKLCSKFGVMPHFFFWSRGSSSFLSSQAVPLSLHLLFLPIDLFVFLKVPKCEIFDRSDCHDIYTIKLFCVGDFGAEI